jgi:putative intracellular protease/amidase
MKSKNILLIVANPAISTTLGWPVGFWASELIHPYDALTKAGHRVTIASPKGGKVELDAYRDPRDASGYSKDEARKLGAKFVTATAFQPFAVRDGNLITGQQQHSGHEVARLVLESLNSQA